MPEARREVLDRRHFQPTGPHVLHQRRQLFVSPEPVTGAITPAALVATVDLRILAGEIVGEMRDDVGRARLQGKLKVIRGELLPVEPKADFHLVVSYPII
jgi:hypothetical protein